MLPSWCMCTTNKLCVSLYLCLYHDSCSLHLTNLLWKQEDEKIEQNHQLLILAKTSSSLSAIRVVWMWHWLLFTSGSLVWKCENYCYVTGYRCSSPLPCRTALRHDLLWLHNAVVYILVRSWHQCFQVSEFKSGSVRLMWGTLVESGCMSSHWRNLLT